MLFSMSFLAAPGHYSVVTMDDTGKAQPVFYREVNFTEERSVSSAMMESTLHDADHLFISGSGWADVAEVPRFIRGVRPRELYVARVNVLRLSIRHRGRIARPLLLPARQLLDKRLGFL